MSAMPPPSQQQPLSRAGDRCKSHVGLVVARLDRRRARARPACSSSAVFAGADEPQIPVALSSPSAPASPARGRLGPLHQSAPAVGARSRASRRCSPASSSPSCRRVAAFDLAGWVWPLLLAALVVSSFRGARRSLANWSRRALLYPALVVLPLIAVGGAVATVMAATSRTPLPRAATPTWSTATAST